MPDVDQGKIRYHAANGESEYGPFVASKKRPHFHRPDCKWAEYLNEWNSLEFGSHREAVEAGKRPCKTCCA
jgi:methylphosphotriester-DNA--protein-cysteine methyltransferase